MFEMWMKKLRCLARTYRTWRINRRLDELEARLMSVHAELYRREVGR